VYFLVLLRHPGVEASAPVIVRWDVVGLDRTLDA
jgi:hypothetical protein